MEAKLTPKGIKILKDAFQVAHINPYFGSYSLHLITEYIQKVMPFQKTQEVSHLGSTKEVQLAIQEMIDKKLF